MEGNREIGKTNVRLDLKNLASILEQRGIEDRGPVQIYIDREAMRLMSPYTPFATGATMDSAEWLTQVGSGEVKQGGDIASWAVKHYYKPANFDGRPMRGDHWFERAMKNGGSRSIFEGVLRMTGAKKK